MAEPVATPRWQRALRLVFFAAALFAFVMAVLPNPPSLDMQEGDKVQHMAAFGTLGALAAAGWPKTRLFTLFLLLALFGALIEIVQMVPSLHRDAEWLDWGADMLAAAVALGVARLILRRF